MAFRRAIVRCVHPPQVGVEHGQATRDRPLSSLKRRLLCSLVAPGSTRPWCFCCDNRMSCNTSSSLGGHGFWLELNVGYRLF